jgi:hypothetical protein
MRRTLLLGLLVGALSCGDSTSSSNGNGGSGGDDGNVECYAQDEVTQTIFVGDPDSLVLADVPDGWVAERFSMQAGYLAHAVSPQDTGRPEVSVGNGLIVMRNLAEAITDDLDAVTSVAFYGEEVTVYLQANQPERGVNLEGYFPTAVGSDTMMMVGILAKFIGSNDERAACQSSLVELVTLVADSIRENPNWGG